MRNPLCPLIMQMKLHGDCLFIVFMTLPVTPGVIVYLGVIKCSQNNQCGEIILPFLYMLKRHKSS